MGTLRCEGNVLTEQMRFLPLITYSEVVTHVIIFCIIAYGWHDLLSDARAFYLTSRIVIYRSKSQRMDCNLN